MKNKEVSFDTQFRYFFLLELINILIFFRTVVQFYFLLFHGGNVDLKMYLLKGKSL